MPTISDVARRAHVSPGTVSRLVNAAENVPSEVWARVEQAIAELSYMPSMAARSLRARRTSLLALVGSNVANLCWRNLTRGVKDTAPSWGYSEHGFGGAAGSIPVSHVKAKLAQLDSVLERQ
jgi:DNA-binding LacI/PurR family transcriptional regulator